MWRSSAFYLTLDTDVWLVSPPPGFKRFPDRNELARSPDRLLAYRRAFDEAVLQRHLESGIEIIARRNGTVIFDFGGMPSALAPEGDEEPGTLDDAVEAISNRVRVMNGYLLCLHSAFLELEQVGRRNMRVTARDLVHVDDDRSGMGGPGLLRIPLGTGFETREIFRPEIVSEEALVHAVEKLDHVLKHPVPEAPAWVALLNEAHTSYQEHDYQLALVSAWTVCEAMLNHRWREHVASRRLQKIGENEVVVINKKRRKRLERSSDLTASIITEVLNLSGDLSFTLYEQLVDARRGRNKWLHELERPDLSSVKSALTAAATMLEETLHTRFDISLGRTI